MSPRTYSLSAANFREKENGQAVVLQGMNFISVDATVRLAAQPPGTARFQIASEALVARQATSSASFGSDEVGIRVLAILLLADLTPGAVQEATFRFDDVDSGERRNMAWVLFSHQENIAAVAR